MANLIADYMPFNFEQEMLIDSHYNPSPKMRNNKAFRFWCRALFQRAISIIDADLPDSWSGTNRDFFFECLFKIGFVCVYYDKKFGLVFQPCGLNGRNIYYQPVTALVNNPVYKNTLELKLGSEASLLKLTPDFIGIYDIVSYYAERLASLDGSIMVAIANSRFGKIALATNKSSAEALKKVYDSIQEGEPFKVVSDKQFAPNDRQSDKAPWNLLQLEGSKDTYILTDVLRDAQTILNAFDAEIGIPTLPYQKKERMVSDEASMRNYDGKARSLTWIKCLESTAEETNKVLAEYLDKPIKFALHYEDETMSEDDINSGEVDKE